MNEGQNHLKLQIIASPAQPGPEGAELDTLLQEIGLRTLVAHRIISNACVETTADSGFVLDYRIELYAMLKGNST